MSLPLNDAQRRAVDHPSGPVLVLAGAGTGKTRVLTARIAALIGRGVSPRRILAVTFTNKAAREMRDRVERLLGAPTAGLWIGTFHAIAARLLRLEGTHLGFTSGFTIYDEDDQLALVRRLQEHLGISPKEYAPRLLRSIISHAKNRMVSPASLGEDAYDPVTRAAVRVYAALGEALRAANAMDFDDLLLHPLTLFAQHPERLAAWQERFEHVLVDEFQDTNRAQYLLVRHLAGRRRNLCVVGDDDQSIYGWRGADVRNMLDFQRDFPGAVLIRLEENYRSTQPILSVANAVIATNRERLGKTLRPTRSGGEIALVCAAVDEREEAEWVVRELEEQRLRGGWSYRDMAVLYRINAQSRAFEEACRRRGVPYQVVGAVGFYERREVKDLLAYLRLIANPRDDEAFFRAVRVPRRGVGETTLKALAAHAADTGRAASELAAWPDTIPGIRPAAARALERFATLLARLRAEPGADAPPATLLEQLVSAIDYQGHLEQLAGDGIDRWENVEELIASAAEWADATPPGDDEGGTPLERFLAQAALLTSSDQTVRDDALTLMTLHTAKGLEWPIVVVAGLEDGLLPLGRAAETLEGLEEERRLCYVGVTRARDRLYLTWARSRRRGGEMMWGTASRFFEDLTAVVAEQPTRHGWRPSPSRAPTVPGGQGGGARWDPAVESQDAPRYVRGERVRHRTFGSGTIVELDRGGGDLKVVVSFDDSDVGTRALLARLAALEPDWDGA